MVSTISANSFEDTKSDMQKTGIQVRTCDTIDSLYLLSGSDFNGLILEKDTNKVVCMSNKKFKQIENDSEIENLKNGCVDLKVEYCEDGTVIRLYNYKGMWYTATSKCLDARKSHWSSNKSFDEMFWETFQESNFMRSLENGLDSLDTDYTYLFILFHTENRIVIRHTHNSLMYINCMHNSTGHEDYTGSNVQQLSVFDRHLNDFFVNTKRGLLLKFYKSDGSYEAYQYDFPQYTSVKAVRGNVPFIRTRILELLRDPESLQMLETIYSEYLLTFSMVKKSLDILYKDIHKMYIESHIKHHVQIYEAHPLYKTLKQLHGQYKTRILEDPKYFISIDEVKSKVNLLNPAVLSKLLEWSD
jgi:hypothetical protein